MKKSKPIDFRTFKKIKTMPLNEFNRWLMDLCSDVYDDGFTYAMKDVSAELTDDKLMEILLSVKGIGKKRAEEVLTKVMEEGTYYGDET